MRKFQATVIETTCLEVVVECADESWCDLEDCAIAAARAVPAEGNLRMVEARQIEGAWLRSVRPYDRGNLEPGDVVVLEAPRGHRFTANQEALLRARFGMLGLDVHDCWNGPGCTSWSFRVSGREGEGGLDFSASDKAILYGTPAEVPDRAAAWSDAARAYYLAIESYYAAGTLEAGEDGRANAYLDAQWSRIEESERVEIERAFLGAGRRAEQPS
jgi:hypothetical protein